MRAFLVLLVLRIGGVILFLYSLGPQYYCQSDRFWYVFCTTCILLKAMIVIPTEVGKNMPSLSQIPVAIVYELVYV